eukprot:TRINITY_DN28295_c0_g1_i1.p1 TRINITY_DN28295_c0_g1~~TRINITY_DN28295_c0_g1_i1.p1  ORF type:complete len:232 (+),score=64.74 TRINITY_DN28295_c0_g1_i1:259-954(+)
MVFAHTALRQADKQIKHYLQERDLAQARSTYAALATALALHGKQEDEVMFKTVVSKLQVMKESAEEEVRDKGEKGIQAVTVEFHQQHESLEQQLDQFLQTIKAEDADPAAVAAAYDPVSTALCHHLDTEEPVLMPVVIQMAWDEQAKVWSECCQALTSEELETLLTFVVQYNPVAMLEALLHNVVNCDKLQGSAAGPMSREQLFALVKGHTSQENWAVLVANCPEYQLQNV